MKHLIIISALLFSGCASAQEVISRTQDLVNYGGNFYLIDSTLTDNGTDTANLSITRTLLGDTAVTARFIMDKATGSQDVVARDISESFRRARANTDFARLRTIYNTITGGEMFSAIETEYMDTYRGRYRVDDLAAGTNFFAILDRSGPGGRFRLVSEADGSQWVILPLSVRNFRIQGWQGENIDMYWNGVSRKDGALIYYPVGQIEGTAELRIIKILNL